MTCDICNAQCGSSRCPTCTTTINIVEKLKQLKQLEQLEQLEQRADVLQQEESARTDLQCQHDLFVTRGNEFALHFEEQARREAIFANQTELRAALAQKEISSQALVGAKEIRREQVTETDRIKEEMDASYKAIQCAEEERLRLYDLAANEKIDLQNGVVRRLEIAHTQLHTAFQRIQYRNRGEETGLKTEERTARRAILSSESQSFYNLLTIAFASRMGSILLQKKQELSALYARMQYVLMCKTPSGIAILQHQKATQETETLRRYFSKFFAHAKEQKNKRTVALQQNENAQKERGIGATLLHDSVAAINASVILFTLLHLLNKNTSNESLKYTFNVVSDILFSVIWYLISCIVLKDILDLGRPEPEPSTTDQPKLGR